MEQQQKELIQKVIRVFHHVHQELGNGFHVSVYEAAMQRVLCEKGLHCERQVPIEVFFQGECVGEFRADLLVDGKALLKLNATRMLTAEHEAQLLNHLRATHFEVGLLLNFGARPEFKHFAYANFRKKHSPDAKTLAGNFAR